MVYCKSVDSETYAAHCDLQTAKASQLPMPVSMARTVAMASTVDHERRRSDCEAATHRVQFRMGGDPGSRPLWMTQPKIYMTKSVYGDVHKMDSIIRLQFSCRALSF